MAGSPAGKRLLTLPAWEGASRDARYRSALDGMLKSQTRRRGISRCEYGAASLKQCVKKDSWVGFEEGERSSSDGNREGDAMDAPHLLWSGLASKLASVALALHLP